MPPVIDQSECLKCEECAAMRDCPQDVFSDGANDEDVTIVLYPKDCIGCGICVDVCEGQAIILEK